ncbi:MAG: hypothetical protein KDH20_06530 [Rhodocyclaceae bacterium]|nr:hypothetical protein [Rhodocyclaceae bacterium]
MTRRRPRPPDLTAFHLLFGLWLMLAWTLSAAGVVDVWMPRSGALQQEFLAAFEGALKEKGHNVGAIHDLGVTPRPTPAPGKVIVALGRDATAQALDAGATAVLSVLVSRRDALALHADDATGKLGAIVLDQPIPRRLAMLRILAPDVASVAVLLGISAPEPAAALNQAIEAAGFTPRLATVEREQEIVPALERVLTPDSALLATPDPGIFNRDTVMSILLTSYRHRRPVIGFTPAYVRAGAVAGVFSTPADIALQATQLLTAQDDLQAFKRGILDPEHFRVAINQRVSRSLGLPEISEDTLRTRLLDWEAGR